MIQVPNIECDVVDVCNLKCADCGHLSPLYSKNYYTFEEFTNDVHSLSKVLRCGSFTFVGGEPLILGEALRKYVNVIRSSDITSNLHIITNGILLEKNTELMNLFDRIEVSVYDIPQRPKIEEWIRNNTGKVKEIMVHHRDQFGKSFSALELSTERAQKSWDECGAKTKCNCIYKGYYYRCTPVFKFPKVLKKMGTTVISEGCYLYGDNLEDRLRDYINRTNRLAACSYCFGHIDMVPWKEETFKKIL